MIWGLEEEMPKRKSREELIAAIPDHVREAALAMLHSPQLLAFIAESIELCGVAGEYQTAMLVYLTGTSRVLERPLAAIVQGPSSSGKSYLLDKVASLFPPEMILMATDITDNALYYLPKGELSHRFVLAGERPRGLKEETGQGTKALREMISSGRLSKVVTISTPDGPETKIIDQPGPIAYAESTTATEIFEEDANRCLIMLSDERPEQTRRILLAHGRRSAGHAVVSEQQSLREVLRALQLLIEPLPIVVPYAETLAELFPCERVEARRAFGQVEGVIQTLALLSQYQRPRDASGQVIAQAEDYAVARMLLEPILTRSLGSRDADGLRHFVDRLQSVSGEFTAKQLAQLVPYSERTIRDSMNELVARGLVQLTREHRGQIPAIWNIRTPFALNGTERSLLPIVSEVCGIDESTLTLPEMWAEPDSANISDVPF